MELFKRTREILLAILCFVFVGYGVHYDSNEALLIGVFCLIALVKDD